MIFLTLWLMCFMMVLISLGVQQLKQPIVIILYAVVSALFALFLFAFDLYDTEALERVMRAFGLIP